MASFCCKESWGRRWMLGGAAAAIVALGAASGAGLSPRSPFRREQAAALTRGFAARSSRLAVDERTESSRELRAASATEGSSHRISGPWQRAYDLAAGEVVEISVRLERPSALPPNGRISVAWRLTPASEASPADWRKVLHALDGDVTLFYRAPVAGRYTLALQPVTDEEPASAGPRWREKGTVLDLAPVPSRTPSFLLGVNGGGVAAKRPGAYPRSSPKGTVAPVSVLVRRVSFGGPAEEARLRTVVECEPNDTPELAQPIELSAGNGIRTWEVTGGADDVEFFDNGRVGRSGDDWFRLEYRGAERRLLTAQLSMPGQVLAARIRAYRLVARGSRLAAQAVSQPANHGPIPFAEKLQFQAASREPRAASATEGSSLPIEEYREGQDRNERVHQQDEEHRANICRILKPGGTYFLRVEANAPGYQLQLRVLKPAPYDDPRMAIRQALYTQIGQVDAWLTNRPRGASIERRTRDSGNLLGTQCMSCHTQSGVWGPAAPLARGYPLENVQNYWHLVNVMYECLRPTNVLKDAANNTSLAPLDTGDGPAGTRAAGFNIVQLERFMKPRRLHSQQQIRTANFVLQTGDPGGINAAGPGSNIGQVVVYLFASEILKTAWEKTGDPRYFRALEEKARRVLAVTPKFTDDVALRLHYFGRGFPLDRYPAEARRAEAAERRALSTITPTRSQDAGVPARALAAEPTVGGAGARSATEGSQQFVARAKAQLAEDEARLRALQNPDGSWGFNPGTSPDGGKTWKRAEEGSDPSPTALGILGLTAMGHGPSDPAVSRAVRALLKMQEPTGRWNKAAQTGFVTTAYALHALSNLYPIPRQLPRREEFTPKAGETLLATLHRVQSLALTAEPKFVDLMLDAARHESPLVRYWAVIGLGGTHTPRGVPALVAALGDRAKMVRDAATWALRQTLLDDHGWDAVFNAYDRGDDSKRAQVLQALGMRADAVMSRAHLDWGRLTALLDRAMNRDPHPAVRAWAAKAAWQWWVWNPPVRPAINDAWVRMLERPESSALVENSLRYSSQALFIANGHKANGSREHQYKELAALFGALSKRLDAPGSPETKARLVARLVGIGATFYNQSGGDGGPGQMGYVTPGAAEMMGKAALAYLGPLTGDRGNGETGKRGDGEAESRGARQGVPVSASLRLSVSLRLLQAVRLGLEGASGVPYQPLTEFLMQYALKGPEDLRGLAASALSDPRSVSLAAVPELVEPQLRQVQRGAMEPPRREQISDPIVALWRRVNWVIPKTEEQQRSFFDLIIPRFDRYASPAEIKTTVDAAQRLSLEREMDGAWYLADRLGEAMQENPDLHQEIVLRRYFPEQARNPLEAHYWVRSIDWILTHGNGMPAGNAARGRGSEGARERRTMSDRFLLRSLAPSLPRPLAPSSPDPILLVKDRALQLYLEQLRPEALPRTREVAVRMANRTALRRNPEVLLALSNLQKVEKDEELQEVIARVLKQGTERFLPDLMAALKREQHPTVSFGADGEPRPSPAQIDDILYFRDYVMPELNRQKRSDQMACMGCHGVPGRVPSMQLRAPDEVGYSAVGDLLYNYRTLQQRVSLTDLPKSKLLRKPLNVQDGQEDGHQGGRRYAPADEGYLILKRWVEYQPTVQKPATMMAEGRAP